MSRHLSIQRTTVPNGEREKYFERLKATKAHYAGANCRFWVFEEAGLPGAFLEFFEASDAATLAKAHAAAPEQVLDPNRVYQEVELK